MTLTERLKELEALDKKRTQRGWEISRSDHDNNGPHFYVRDMWNTYSEEEFESNQKIIAAIPSTVILAKELHALLVECGKALESASLALEDLGACPDKPRECREQNCPNILYKTKELVNKLKEQGIVG